MNKDKEILLRKAKQLYPIGAKVIGLGSGEEVIIDSDHEFSNYDRIAVKIVSDYPIDIDFIYDSGKWAEVIEYPAEYTIKPEDMISEEYYLGTDQNGLNGYLLQFTNYVKNDLITLFEGENIRPATKAEIAKDFPEESTNAKNAQVQTDSEVKP